MKKGFIKFAIWILRISYKKFIDYPWDRLVLAVIDILEYYYGKQDELGKIRDKIRGVSE